MLHSFRIMFHDKLILKALQPNLIWTKIVQLRKPIKIRAKKLTRR